MIIRAQIEPGRVESDEEAEGERSQFSNRLDPYLLAAEAGIDQRRGSEATRRRATRLSHTGRSKALVVAVDRCIRGSRAPDIPAVTHWLSLCPERSSKRAEADSKAPSW